MIKLVFDCLAALLSFFIMMYIIVNIAEVGILGVAAGAAGIGSMLYLSIQHQDVSFLDGEEEDSHEKKEDDH